MSDTAKAWVEERRAIHRNRHVKRSAWSEATRDWAVEFPKALNALEQVLELHKPVPHEWADWRVCAECCSPEGGAPIKYPCSTIEAIGGAIND